MTTGIMGFAWWRPEDWPRLLEVAADRASLPQTFEGFEQRAGAQLKALRARGVRVEKMIINVDDLVAFCRAFHRPIDSPTRASYVAIVLARRREMN